MKIQSQNISKWIGGVLFAGVCLTLLATEWTYRVEERHRRDEFQERAQSRVMVVSSVWSELIVPLRSIQAFFNASSTVSRDEFSIFAQTYIEQNFGVGYFAWMPAVFDVVVPLHESHGRAEGLERYQIKPLPRFVEGGGAPLSSPISFPLFYVEPFWGHDDLLGLDMASDPVIREILQEACDQNQLSARIHPKWLQPGASTNCICMVAPVHSKAGYPFSEADRRNNLMGYVLAVYDVSVLINKAISLTPKQSVDCVIDIGTDGQMKNLYVWFARTRSSPKGHISQLLNNAAYRYETTTRFLDVDLNVRCSPAPGFFKENPIVKTWFVLGGGWGLTVLVGYILYRVSLREIRIQQLVEARTEQLQEKTTFLNTFITAIPLPVFYKDTKGRYMGMNVAFEKMYGLAPGEGVGKTLFDLAPLATAEFLYARDLELFQRAGTHVFEATLMDAEGVAHHLVFHKATFANAEGKTQGLVGAIIDDTEVKRTTEKMSRIFSAVNGYSDGVLLADEKGRPTYINMALGCHFDILPEAMEHIHLEDLFVDPQQGKDILSALLASVPWAGEVQMKSTNGTVFPVLLRGSPTINDHFEVVGFSLILTDLTERKKLEHQMAHMQKMESVGHLAAGIAHEINTPIQFVGDNLSFLQDSFGELFSMLERFSSPPEMASDVEYLRTEVPKALAQSKDGIRRVSEIVRAMKEFSHPGVANQSMADLNCAIETTLTIARNEWKYVAEVETHFDAGLPPVSCWPGDINQVLLNLIVNAAHAIREAKRGEGGDKGRISITTVQGKEFVEIRVADNGAGIPEKVQPHIFTPFFTTKEVGKGTGQGLAMAYNVIVKKHGGSIWFESKPGEGTTFFVRIPLDVSSPSESTS